MSRYAEAIKKHRFPPEAFPAPEDLEYPLDGIDYAHPPTDRYYWGSLRRCVFEHYGAKHHLAQKRWDVVKRRRFEAQRKPWREGLPPDMIAWAEVRLKEEFDRVGPENVDNVYVADARRSSAMRRFKRRRAGGCCGRHEWSAVGPDGRLYVFGFNYGH